MTMVIIGVMTIFLAGIAVDLLVRVAACRGSEMPLAKCVMKKA